MVGIINRHPTDPRPLFLYASLHVVHNPIEAPAEFVSLYTESQPDWCPKKQTIAAMASVADNVTAQIVAALRRQSMWSNTLLVFSSDNGGDSGCSSNFPLRGRKRTFFEGGVRAVSFLASPLLPPARRGGRTETATIHVSDWYATFGALAGVADPTDSGDGRFAVDGRNLWPLLSRPYGTQPPPGFAKGVLVLGFNYSSLCFGDPPTPAEHCHDGYTRGSGALIEPATGYKLIVGSQNLNPDCLQWDTPDYPCKRSAAGADCYPHCLFNLHDDPSERRDLSSKGGGNRTEADALTRLLAIYSSIGGEPGMPNPLDVRWNEQGTPYDPEACKTAIDAGGYWQPWLESEHQ